MVRHTLPRLLADATVHAVFDELRAKGWKDWHLLVAVGNLVLNERASAKYGAPTVGNLDTYKQRFLAEMNRPEGPNDASVTADSITRQSLEAALHRSAVSTLHLWGLELHHPKVEFPAIMHVLGTRYGYWHDDVEHQQLFPAP